MRDLLLPTTDAGVVAQADLALVVLVILFVLARRARDLRLLVVGTAVFTAGTFLLRAALTSSPVTSFESRPEPTGGRDDDGGQSPVRSVGTALLSGWTPDCGPGGGAGASGWTLRRPDRPGEERPGGGLDQAATRTSSDVRVGVPVSIPSA
jgi:hypothetical protein